MRLYPFTIVVAAIASAAALAACAPPENAQPTCEPGPPVTLMAESVPTAAFIPCVRELPSGWAFDGFSADERTASFAIMDDVTGATVEVRLQARCRTDGQEPMSSQRSGIRQSQIRSPDGSTTIWTSVFEGGCARARIDLPSGSTEDTVATIRVAIGFIERSAVRGS